jgi:RNA polymerase sporulation-specific sigma factor
MLSALLTLTKFFKFFKFIPDPILYIGGNEALPPPLSPEEESELIQKLSKEGDQVRKILIERNLRLVVYISKKFENTGIGIEDLISIGTIGLIKSINTFKPDKKIKLATYASRCIENEILMFLRRSSKSRSDVSIDEPLNTDWDGNELLLSDVLGTENDTVQRGLEDEVEKQLLTSAIKKLSSREREIVDLRFGLSNGEEKTQKEVADLLGISQSYISRLEKRILGRLKVEICRLT